MISLIVAVSENNCIGSNNQMPWHLPEDLRRFRSLTAEHAVIMGRKTYEAIGRPLPQRHNIIVSRNSVLNLDGCDICGSLDEALKLESHQDPDEVFIIGGAEIYRQALPLAKKLYLTRIHKIVDGDTFFPEIDWSQWALIETPQHSKNPANGLLCTFLTYQNIDSV